MPAPLVPQHKPMEDYMRPEEITLEVLFLDPRQEKAGAERIRYKLAYRICRSLRIIPDGLPRLEYARTAADLLKFCAAVYNTKSARILRRADNAVARDSGVGVGVAETIRECMERYGLSFEVQPFVPRVAWSRRGDRAA